MSDLVLMEEVFNVIASGDWKLTFRKIFNHYTFMTHAESAGTYFYSFDIWCSAEGEMHLLDVTVFSQNEITVLLKTETENEEKIKELNEIANQLKSILSKFLENHPKTRLYMLTGCIKVADSVIMNPEY